MILQSLEVINFRQLAGTSHVAFAPPGKRNVTIILGENGSGKSTLLNAFRWCLYGTIEMENPDEILSHQAVYDAKVDDAIAVKATLQFDHAGVSYTAIRFREFRKSDGGDAVSAGDDAFQLTRVAVNGATEAIGDPVGFIRNLLPENLSRFFFFQGESILQLALQRSREALRDGVETLLDFKVLESAIKHLSVVERDFEKELKANADETLASLQGEIDQVKSQLDDLDDTLEQQRKNLHATEIHAEEQRQDLAKVESLQPIMKEIAIRQSEAEAKARERDALDLELRKHISGDAFLLLAPELLEVPLRLAEEAVTKGELPAKIKPGFVKDILDVGKCICGKGIDSEMRATLTEWLRKTGLADLESAVDGLRKTAIRYRTTRVDRFRKEHRTLLDDLAAVTDEIRIAVEKKSLAERELGEVDVEESEIEQKREAYSRNREAIGRLKADIELTTGRVEEKLELLNSKDRQRTALLKERSKEQVLGRRIAAACNVSAALTKIKNDWTAFVQGHLDQLLKRSWNDVAQLPRQVSFTSEFALSIEERGGSGEWVTSAPSEANCAVLALTFVAALIEFASEIGKDPNQRSMFAGGEYPLVMDAPFAKMDEDFKRKVPLGLAHVVPQVVLISSLDQWRGDVSESLEDQIGKAYVLTLHKPGVDHDIRKVKAVGQDVDYVITEPMTFTDWSEIQEIEL